MDCMFFAIAILSNPQLQPNVINLRLGVIHVGAAFQPRLSGYCVRATFFVAGKPLPRKIDVKSMTLTDN